MYAMMKQYLIIQSMSYTIIPRQIKIKILLGIKIMNVTQQATSIGHETVTVAETVITSSLYMSLYC
jgi:hypothetical protein